TWRTPVRRACRARHRTPVAGTAMTAVAGETLVDHAWIDNGLGLLSCVGGNRHSSDTAVVCPYYLRSDIAAALAPRLARTTGTAHGTVPWRGERYVKITQLCPPSRWASLLAALPTDHGLRPMAWSLFTGLDTARWVSVLDPRDAVRTALRGDNPIAALLAGMCSALGDPGNEAGTLGLTGSVALNPGRLDGPRIDASGDIDVMVYPSAERDALAAALTQAGGKFPADLPDGDPGRVAYQQSRLMPPTTDEFSRAVFWRRRRDLAWIGSLRLDLTLSDPGGTVAPSVVFARPPAGPWSAVVTVASVYDRYPVTLRVEHPRLTHVWITARGYQTTLRPGDRLALRGLLHHPPDGPAFASVDDAAGHQLILLRPGGQS
ncbi:MAG: hypothetical protein ACRDRL_23130, partial [Sciscionella sp.]